MFRCRFFHNLKQLVQLNNPFLREIAIMNVTHYAQHSDQIACLRLHVTVNFCSNKHLWHQVDLHWHTQISRKKVKEIHSVLLFKTCTQFLSIHSIACCIESSNTFNTKKTKETISSTKQVWSQQTDTRASIGLVVPIAKHTPFHTKFENQALKNTVAWLKNIFISTEDFLHTYEESQPE